MWNRSIPRDLHEKSVQKNKPLCLHFDRFWHWKPCYYYIYWTLFSAHCLCYIHIDTTSIVPVLFAHTGSYVLLYYYMVFCLSIDHNCVILLKHKMISYNRLNINGNMIGQYGSDNYILL